MVLLPLEFFIFFYCPLMGWGGFILSVYNRRIFEWFFCPVDSLRLVVFADVGNIGLFCGLCHLGCIWQFWNIVLTLRCKHLTTPKQTQPGIYLSLKI